MHVMKNTFLQKAINLHHSFSTFQTRCLVTMGNNFVYSSFIGDNGRKQKKNAAFQTEIDNVVDWIILF